MERLSKDPKSVHVGQNSIMHLIDASEDDTQIQLHMDYMAGGDLFSRIQNVGCFTEVGARNVILQICQGLRSFPSVDR